MSARLDLAIDKYNVRIWILMDQRVHKGHAHRTRAHNKMSGFEAFHGRIIRKRCATTEIVRRDGVLCSGLDQLCHFRAADETEAEGDEERREVRTLVHFVLPVRDSFMKINEVNVLPAKSSLSTRLRAVRYCQCVWWEWRRSRACAHEQVYFG